MGVTFGSAGKESACNAGDLILGWEDPLEKGKATDSRILAWRIGHKESERAELLSLSRWIIWDNLILNMKVKVKLLSRVRLFVTPWTVAHQAPPSMGFSGQEYWSGLPFPSPGNLPDPGIESRSPTLQTDALTSEPPGNPIYYLNYLVM